MPNYLRLAQISTIPCTFDESTANSYRVRSPVSSETLVIPCSLEEPLSAVKLTEAGTQQFPCEPSIPDTARGETAVLFDEPTGTKRLDPVSEPPSSSSSSVYLSFPSRCSSAVSEKPLSDKEKRWQKVRDRASGLWEDGMETPPRTKPASCDDKLLYRPGDLFTSDERLDTARKKYYSLDSTIGSSLNTHMLVSFAQKLMEENNGELRDDVTLTDLLGEDSQATTNRSGTATKSTPNESRTRGRKGRARKSDSAITSSRVVCVLETQDMQGHAVDSQIRGAADPYRTPPPVPVDQRVVARQSRSDPVSRDLFASIDPELVRLSTSVVARGKRRGRLSLLTPKLSPKKKGSIFVDEPAA